MCLQYCFCMCEPGKLFKKKICNLIFRYGLYIYLNCFQESIYDPVEKTGFLVNRLKNMSRKVHRQEKIQPILIATEDIQNTEYEDLHHFLKSAELPGQISIVKEKMLLSIEGRRKQILEQGIKINIKREFPFFFVEPDLVSSNQFKV
jgi:hypothetical protein